MKYARLVLRNLSRNLRRTTLTTFAIALAVFTYATLSGLRARAPAVKGMRWKTTRR